MERNIDGDIRENLSKSLADVLRAFTDGVNNKKDIRFYTGIIVDNNDPEQEGKCRIRVYGVYGEEIPNEDLPWAVPDFSFIGSTKGSFIVPPNESIVKVYFDNEDFYSPRYTTKVFNRNALNSFTAGYNEDYPNTMIFFETDQGDYFKVNRATNETIYRHASGFIVKIDSEGNLLIDDEGVNTGNVDINTKGNLNISVGGNCNIEAQGALNMKGLNTTVEGVIDITMKAPGASRWFPNTLPADPFSTVPHGGIPAGLISIKSAG
jgi:hypothetical protein